MDIQQVIRKTCLLLLILTAGCTLLRGAPHDLALHTFGEIDSLQKIEKRRVVIFIYTDWCRYCQAMEHITFADRNIIDLLNEKFWFANLNGEESRDIVFNGHTFRYQPAGSNTGMHELAEQLGTINGPVSYPTLCILDPDYNILFQHNRYLPPQDLMKVLLATLRSSY